MYAVIQSGGRQYRVGPEEKLNVDKLSGEVGDKLELSQVLLVNDGSTTKVGTPFVEGASVNLEIVEQKKGPKLIIFKKIRRHGKQLKKGHRQDFTTVKVTNIQG